jgi:hypothetical protein
MSKSARPTECLALEEVEVLLIHEIETLEVVYVLP